MAAFEVLAALVAVSAVIYYYLTSTADFWAKRGIPFIAPSPFFGSSKDFFFNKVFRGEIGRSFYNYAKEGGHKYVGVFLGRRPVLIPCDVDVVKTMLVKDFHYVTDRGMFYDRKREPLSANLFNLGGSEWKTLRAKLSPTFTTGKMKNMFYLVSECARGLEHFLEEEASKQRGSVEMNEALARYSTDVIGSCAFGIEANSLKDPDAEFRTMGREVFTISRGRAFLQVIAESLPMLRRVLPLPLIKRNVSSFFTRTFNENVQYREQQKVVRHDFLDLLLQLKHSGADGSAGADSTGIDVDILPAQAFIFFLAGFETSSGATSACLMNLAQHQDVQDRLREEVDRVLAKHGGVMSYEALQEMKYMEQCLEETMRMFPALGLLPRVVTRDYQLPDCKATVPAGTRILIPVYAIHHDPEFYPEPSRFDPDRFTEDAKSSRPHYAYLPFGEGPRICIGMRFAWMQMKSALTVVLRSYKVTPNEHTVYPLKFDTKSFVSKIDGGAHVTLTRR